MSDVIQVESPGDRLRFIQLPWSIYRDQPSWVPPLLLERKKFLNSRVNPFFEHAEVNLFLALDDHGIPVGRIAVVLDHRHNEFRSEDVGFFGMFESINDPRTAALLLDTARDWARARGLRKIRGPMNLSINHECGLLVDGFDLPPMLGMPYNPPYYETLFTGWGLVGVKDLVSLRIEKPRTIPEYLERASARIRKRNRFTIRPLRLDRFPKEIDILWDLYNSAWSDNWGFVPLTRREFSFAADEMARIVEPELCLIAEMDGRPVGFSLTLPNLNEALKPLNGKLFPWGWIRFIRNRKRIQSYRILTLGVKKQFQRMGIDVRFYYETYRQCIKRKATVCEMSWILEDNRPMLAPLHRMGASIYKRHRIYEADCEH